ncbi:MAG: Alanine dehydrogenase [Chlamydiia bacterium]|nr:Alanine dehydrogenase [Chlamydiia bacterium]MCH9616620.1 Alanine dehydrogenase [Chlamydiia bacterium]MCH9629350.1 Alanine dehydrogenase [Chlamydiia bacterium]
MLIGIPKEVKNHENRVGATPAMVYALVSGGHEVLIEKGAGERIGFSDAMYEESGAKIVEKAIDVYSAEMIIKVKEPQPSEYGYLKEDQILFTYLHLAPDPEQTKALLEAKVVGIAYETVIDKDGRLPLLTPMSEVAGRIAIQAGASALQMAGGGRGVLLGGVPGVAPGKVMIIGAGVVGTNAAKMAMGLGANVTILDRSLNRLRELDELYGARLTTMYSTPQVIKEHARHADLIIGAVLIPGKMAPKLVDKQTISEMKKGAVIVDVAIDQGGCFETSRPTTHADPVYEVDGVVHYCVTNMPGGCARTATMALTNATMPFALKIASLGYKKALLEDPWLLPGLNVYQGKVTNRHVAMDLGYDYFPPEKLL